VSSLPEEIGGYFELELHKSNCHYSGVLALNSARNALVYLIKSRGIRNLFMPYCNCRVVANAITRFCPDTAIHYYHINIDFSPKLGEVPIGSYIYYVNYYGLKDDIPVQLYNYHVILDNAQAFYSLPLEMGDTIYCPRKFFGVSDGGYLHSTARLDIALERDTSWENSLHLLKRIDCGASEAYADFQSADLALTGRPLKRMSRFTERILNSIDYATVKKTRLANFNFLHSYLAEKNSIKDLIVRALTNHDFGPLCYPLYTFNADQIRKKLISEKIYIPVYWPELRESSVLNRDELNLVNNIVCLPVDQRYNEKTMSKTIDLLRGLVL
jgi:hypothetical protein